MDTLEYPPDFLLTSQEFQSSKMARSGPARSAGQKPALAPNTDGPGALRAVLPVKVSSVRCELTFMVMNCCKSTTGSFQN